VTMLADSQPPNSENICSKSVLVVL